MRLLITASHFDPTRLTSPAPALGLAYTSSLPETASNSNTEILKMNYNFSTWLDAILIFICQSNGRDKSSSLCLVSLLRGGDLKQLWAVTLNWSATPLGGHKGLLACFYINPPPDQHLLEGLSHTDFFFNLLLTVMSCLCGNFTLFSNKHH